MVKRFLAPWHQRLSSTFDKGLESVDPGVDVLPYAAVVDIDFDGRADSPVKEVTLAGNITFTFSNLAAGRSVSLRIVGDGVLRTLTFPAGVNFLGAGAPVDIAAGKTAVVAFTSYGVVDADVDAAYSVEP